MTLSVFRFALIALASIAGLLSASLPVPQEFSARVIGISDGDTIRVLKDDVSIRVRLLRICGTLRLSCVLSNAIWRVPGSGRVIESDTMTSHISEEQFESYLKKHGLSYEPTFTVNPGNVDFRVTVNGVGALCDVKAVTTGGEDYTQPVSAQKNIRRDVALLKRKFAQPPSEPCVLVCMNYSSGPFSLFSVNVGLFGDLDVELLPDDQSARFVPAEKPNAVLRHDKYQQISGVLIYDPMGGEHRYMPNPYADNPLTDNFFPGVVTVEEGCGDTIFIPVS